MGAQHLPPLCVFAFYLIKSSNDPNPIAIRCSHFFVAEAKCLQNVVLPPPRAPFGHTVLEEFDFYYPVIKKSSHINSSLSFLDFCALFQPP